MSKFYWDSDILEYFQWLLLIMAWVVGILGTIVLMIWGLSHIKLPAAAKSYEQQSIDSCTAKNGTPEYNNTSTTWGNTIKVSCKK